MSVQPRASRSASREPPRPPAGAPPLWRLLGHCADAVAAVQAGRSLTDALEACPPAVRPGTQALSFAVMRRLGLARRLRALLVPRAPAPWVDGLLLSALALACGDEYSPHTLVDQAVDAAKRGAKPASGMVNAVLRRFLREREALLAKAEQDPEARWNHPRWWIDQVKQDWPEHWQALLQANQQPGPMVLRVNRRHGSRDHYLERLREAGQSAIPVLDDGLLLAQPVPVHQLPGFAQGDVSVQDTSAQRAAKLLLQALGPDIQPGTRVLDACSAPGGKTAHLLEAADLALLALDADATRLRRVDETLQRLNLPATTQATTRTADAADTATWWDGRPFDAILLDAPCSGSGIVRRHPDARWLRRATDIPALADTQDRLLDALWPLLAPGGHLLYCTCSLFKQEGEQRIDAFLQRQPQATRLPAPGHLLPVVEYPEPERATTGSPAESAGPRDPGDGFYYALLSKPATR
ncbi:MAG TPA: 16S rRNA (cytosine(967)-C(5))-methyltransferase RsmB [Candidatus Aquabacterium excrementipullorum]|nr:16S rRNA (cytosine(967)-C(5))-methyltransferase RsmB [Candidatus Aquabacterium excrementipullorum]